MDPIANMLVMLKNASLQGHYKVDIPCSKFKMAILNVFKNEGFIKSIKIIKLNNFSYNHIRVYLKYISTKGSISKTIINSIKILSKQSRPIYKKVVNIPRLLNGLGVVVVSTPKGVMSDKEARMNNLGGKLICYIS